MGVDAERSMNAFIIKILYILCIILQLSNLVICGDPDDDSLQNALEFVERRQRDLQLQDNDYYGQPEDIGYGYQKNFGIFENEPATELGSPDSDPENMNDFRNILHNYVNSQRETDYEGAYNKRKSNFRERYSNGLISQRENENNQEGGSDIRCTYVRTLKDLWCKYRQSRPEEVNLEDLSADQVAEILNNLDDEDTTKEDTDIYDNELLDDNTAYRTIPLRSRRNYRVFDRLKEKRFPSFGEGFYGKRSPHSQHLNYGNPSENEFLYALKFVNPEMNREAVENLKEDGYDVFGDEKDKDVMRILNDAANNPRNGQEEEAYWMKKDDPYDEVWLPGPFSYQPDDSIQDVYGEKRAGLKIFKPHNGIHLNNKRIPVKRSSTPEKKEPIEKVANEVKNIFEKEMTSTTTTTIPTLKKETANKSMDLGKKVNASKTENGKKLVRRANEYTKEEIYPKSEIDRIFSAQKVDKKSIDWSQYFGYDKRSQRWLVNDSIRRAENHFLSPKRKRLMKRERLNWDDFSDKSRYEAPFDTRIFNSKKKFSVNMDKNIDTMERKLGNIEEKIIDDAVKFTGAHTGTGNEDMRKVKNEIVHHLEAAYSLEKMKNALEEFKNSMKSEKTFSGSVEEKKLATESPKVETQSTTVRTDKAKTDEPEPEKRKRISTKKEIEDVYGKESLEFLNWPSTKAASSTNDQFENAGECPVLEKSLNNCLKVDEIGGRYSELLLPICSLHQICYMCISEIKFSKPSACDLLYLSEAEKLCQGNRGCLLSARDSMLALRDLHEQELLMGERSRREGSCLFNQCVQKYFMNTPAAVIPLEFQD